MKGPIRFYYTVLHDSVGRSSERTHCVIDTNWSFRCDCDGFPHSLPLRTEHCSFGVLSFSSIIIDPNLITHFGFAKLELTC